MHRLRARQQIFDFEFRFKSRITLKKPSQLDSLTTQARNCGYQVDELIQDISTEILPAAKRYWLIVYE